ncbi:hypothetical protein EV126DRAFT_435670, partial [Verticillium dahliae]
MHGQISRRVKMPLSHVLVASSLITMQAYTVNAFRMPGWYHEEQGSDGPNSGGGSDNSGPQSLSDMSSSSSQSGFAGFDVERASYLRTVHGILALVAFVALFPLGAVLMRLVPGRMSIWFHAVTQLAALALFIASIGLGAYIVNLVQDGGFPLLDDDLVVAHVGIGSALGVVFILMPIMGYLHHRYFKKVGRRTGWSYLHLAGGRVGITLGIINGGIGLAIAGGRYQVQSCIWHRGPASFGSRGWPQRPSARRDATAEGSALAMSQS